MANAGAFKKGEKRPNQGKRGPSKSTAIAREAIARFVDGNTGKLQEWLDDIAADDKHGPREAFRCLMDVMEYHVPKLARVEQTGDPDKPLEIRFSWKK
jgi:hypothetical protein